MKNDWAIIKSNLTENEKKCANMLREINGELRNKIKTIKKVRTYLFDMNISENEFLNACCFHNLLDEYTKTI